MAANRGPYWLASLDEEHKNDSGQWLEYLKTDGPWGLIHLGERLQNDGEFFKEAIKIERDAFRYASEELKFNKKWVLEALSINIEIISLISNELINSSEFINRAKVHDPKNPFIKNFPPVSIQAGLDGAFKNLKKAEAVNNPLDLSNTKFLDDARYSILSFLKSSEKNDFDDYRQYIRLLSSAPFNNDREIVIEALKSNINYSYWDDWFKDLPLKFRSEKEIVLMAVAKYPNCIEYVSDKELLDDREVILAGINSDHYEDYCENGIVFSFASRRLRADRKLLELALPKFGAALNYASKDLQLDIALNKQAIEISSEDVKGYMSSYSLNSMPKEIQHNKEIILHALQYQFLDIGAIPDSLLNDRDIGLAIIKADFTYGFSILGQKLRDDFDLVKKAVEIDGNNLQHASKRLKSNFEIISTALDSSLCAAKFIDPNHPILKNKEEILRIIKKHDRLKRSKPSYWNWWRKNYWEFNDENSFFRFLDKKLREDKDIVLAALPLKAPVLKWTSKELRDNTKVVLKAIRYSGTRCELRHASKRLRDHAKVVKTAMHHKKDNLKFASSRIRSDKKMMLEAVKECSGLKWVDRSLLSNRSLILSAIGFDKRRRSARCNTSINDDGIYRISDDLKADREILYNSIFSMQGGTRSICDAFMEYDKSKYRINNPLLKDKEFILSLIKVNSGMLNVIATQEAFLDVWKDKNFLKKLSYIGSCNNYWEDHRNISIKQMLTIKNNPELIDFLNQSLSKQSQKKFPIEEMKSNYGDDDIPF